MRIADFRLRIADWKPRAAVIVLTFAASWLWVAPLALAQPTQGEVFRSIGENIDGQTRDSGRTMALVAAAGGLALLLVVLSQVRKREVAPKALNHHGKLLREVARNLDLRKSELRQLKLLADERGISSPLTLLLCPSLLSQAAAETRDGRVDSRAVSAVLHQLTQDARRAGARCRRSDPLPFPNPRANPATRIV